MIHEKTIIIPITPAEFDRAISFSMVNNHDGTENWFGELRVTAGLKVTSPLSERREQDKFVAEELRHIIRSRMYRNSIREMSEAIDVIEAETRLFPGEKFLAALDTLKRLARYTPPANKVG